jgi:hypothetical protein
MARNSLSECCGREDSASGNGRKETQEVVMLTSSKQVVEVLSKSSNVKDSVRVSTLSVSDGVNAAMVTVGPLILKDYLAVSQTSCYCLPSKRLWDFHVRKHSTSSSFGDYFV